MAINIFAMPASSVALLFSVAFGITNALPWPGPQQTHVYRAKEFSPKPTGVPVDPGRLFKRDNVDVNVCGWVGGVQSKVASCNSGSSCIHDTLHGFVGCCATTGSCTDGLYTTCLDETSNGWKSVQGLVNNGILTCSKSLTCYRNNYPNNFAQYNCGETNAAADVQLTYAGQPDDMKLQRVYTGVKFSPMSAVPSTTSATATPSPSEQAPAAGKVDPAATPEESSSSSATADGKDYKEKTGAIAGGTVGGIALIAIAISAIILCLRHRQKQKQLRVGGFVSLHQKDNPQTSGPFQRIRPYSPEDFGSPDGSTHRDIYISSPIQATNDTTYISPLTGHPDSSHLAIAPDSADRDLLSNTTPLTSPANNDTFPHTYETAVAIPISRLNKDSPIQSPFLRPDPEQSQPLVSEIDHFSQSWNNAMSHQAYPERDTHIHYGDMPETTDVGLAGAVRRAASTLGVLANKNRTTDTNARSESMRRDSDYEGGNTAWGAQTLRAVQFAENQDVDPPALKEQMMRAFEAATRGGGMSDGDSAGVPVTPVRYQLVDEGPSGDFNVLEGPGKAKLFRPKKGE